MYKFPFSSYPAATAAKSLQSCWTLCDPYTAAHQASRPWDSAGKNTGVAISFSNAWKWKVKVKSLKSCPTLATPWTAAYQAPPSMGFSRQKYWSGVPLPSLSYPANTCYFLSFRWKPFCHVWDGISLRLWFAFPWWLVMMNIFSWVCWPSVRLWENVYSDPLPNF